jgi:serine/threonine-protein phosphatase PGAM5
MPYTLILVRHGEQLDAEHGVEDGPLSPRGVRQAQALADRISGLNITNVWHSPLERAWDTVRVLSERMPSITAAPSALLMDCVPTGLTDEMPANYRAFFKSVTEADIEAGSAQMSDAVAEFMSVGVSKQTDLLVTHNAVIAWFVREALAAPDWKWVTLNQANCGLTVLQHRSGRPWNVVSHNDLGHLPVELRTGLPEPYSI